MAPNTSVLETQEIHVMHPFNADFYGHEMKAVVLGYIRPELDYTSRGAHQRCSRITSHISRNLSSSVHFASLMLSDAHSIVPRAFGFSRGPYRGY